MIIESCVIAMFHYQIPDIGKSDGALPTIGNVTITNVEIATSTDIPRSGISTSDIGFMINDDVITMCTY